MSQLADDAHANCQDNDDVVNVDIVASSSDPAAAQPQSCANNGDGAPSHSLSAELVFEDVYVGHADGDVQGVGVKVRM